MKLRTRTLAGIAAGVVAATGIAGIAATASGAGPVAATARASVVVQSSSLSSDAAVKAAEATIAAAEKGGHRVTVVVMDRAGRVQVLLKGDGAGPQTADSATRKAFTAASFGQPTSKLAERVTGPGATLRDMPNTLFLAGGVPVTVNGEVVGAIGVGGAPSGDLDEQYANAGVATVS